MNAKSAIRAIEAAGALLVFPIGNRKEPASLWSYFHPRKPMRWEWDESGDQGVADLWHLKTELSTTRKVVYTKWYRSRATYLSKPLFAALLRALNPNEETITRSLSPGARRIHEILEGESPLSTKELKRLSEFRGKANEAAYQRALKELWSRMLIVAYGDVDDGAFPSLAVGSTKVLFEPLWKEAFAMTIQGAVGRIRKVLDSKNPFLKHYEKLQVQAPPEKKASRKKGIASVIEFSSLSTSRYH